MTDPETYTVVDMITWAKNRQGVVGEVSPNYKRYDYLVAMLERVPDWFPMSHPALNKVKESGERILIVYRNNVTGTFKVRAARWAKDFYPFKVYQWCAEHDETCYGINTETAVKWMRMPVP